MQLSEGIKDLDFAIWSLNYKTLNNSKYVNLKTMIVF